MAGRGRLVSKVFMQMLFRLLHLACLVMLQIIHDKTMFDARDHQLPQPSKNGTAVSIENIQENELR